MDYLKNKIDIHNVSVKENELGNRLYLDDKWLVSMSSYKFELGKSNGIEILEVDMLVEFPIKKGNNNKRYLLPLKFDKPNDEGITSISLGDMKLKNILDFRLKSDCEKGFVSNLYFKMIVNKEEAHIAKIKLKC